MNIDTIDLNWKYVEPLEDGTIKSIERLYEVELPQDYKKLLKICNLGKPSNHRFDIDGRKGCVFDYMIDLNDLLKDGPKVLPSDFLPIAKDPFGNFIAFKIVAENIESVVFIDHETKKNHFLKPTFSEFLRSLY